MTVDRHLYLVVVGDDDRRPGVDLDDLGPAFEIARGHHLLECDATRSRVYHDVKARLPERTPLLVAPLADTPKFMGQREGALAWIRASGVTASVDRR